MSDFLDRTADAELLNKVSRDVPFLVEITVKVK